MAVYKCKMCGGALEVSGGAAVCRCTYCGTEQTLPKLDNETRNRLYDRANHYRRNSDFDRAEAVYENILSEAPDEAEAHWGLCLCRYGIEYVRDPKSGKMVPTCHRTCFTSILDDPSYLAALRCADGAAESLYRQEAKYIDGVQKRILEVSGREEPFDVFICYKETGSSGQRTSASVAAQEIYEELTEKGCKVFFSRITLEDKLGQEYEPYIFAALRSAPVMLVVGTKPEHFTSPWVRNEWSRYLGMMSQGQKKYIIPCYKDMDPYDLPEELVSLQGQDLSKVGAVQDLVRGVERLIGGWGGAQGSGASSDSLTDRAFLFLEDKNWKSAGECFEKALDADPRNPQAYLGKLLAELRMPSEQAIASYDKPVGDNENFRKAMRFADDSFRKKLDDIEKQCRLNEALRKLDRCRYPSEAEEVLESLRSLEGWGDSLRAAGDAQRRLEELRRLSFDDAEKAINAGASGRDLTNAIRLLKETGDMPGSSSLIERAEKTLADTYKRALAEMESGDLRAAERDFKWLVDYEDALPLGLRCSRMIQQADINARNAAEEEERRAQEEEAIRRNRERAEQNTKRRRVRTAVSVVIIVLMILSLITFLSCMKIAAAHQMVLAQDYRIKMIAASVLLSSLLVYSGARRDRGSGFAPGQTINAAALIAPIITCMFISNSGGDILYLAMLVMIHGGAMFAAAKLGKKAYLYYNS